ncbi:MAG: TetR/AcrR family transcriptional regulator [Steroidobacteraceae bacterium]
MTRPPASKEKVLQAAERIVQRQGAGSLTYDQLVKDSGVSRGGITYHFPTKQQLLQALIVRDMEQWEAMEKSLTPKLQNQQAAELIGSMRALTRKSEAQKRFVSGMLSAITYDQELLAPVREMNQQHYGKQKGTPKEIDMMILELAAAGVFWQDITRCHVMDEVVRKKVIARLEKLAKEWTE